jgi:hypothetical protein
LLNHIRTLSICQGAFIFGQEIHVTSSDSDLTTESLLKVLSESGFSDVDVKQIEPTVEDCFMQLMGK